MSDNRAHFVVGDVLGGMKGMFVSASTPCKPEMVFLFFLGVQEL